MSESNFLHKVFGETIEKLGIKHKNLIVFDSGLDSNLNTIKFAKSFPERHFTIPEAEGAMINMAAGTIVRGKIPFCCAKTSKLINQNFGTLKAAVDLPNLNIKIVGFASGLSNAEEGPGQCSFEDLALMRSLPNFKILSPADAEETKAMTEYMVNEYGPIYLRLPSSSTPNIFDHNYQYHAENCRTIHDGGEQVIIFSTGICLHQSLQAAIKLEHRGIRSKVINVSSISNICSEKLIELAENADLIVTVEDHILHGGLGSLVVETLNQTNPKKTLKLGITLPAESGKFEDLLSKNQIDAQGIYEQIKNAWIEI